MEYTKRRRYTVNVETTDLHDIYQHDLQMYDFAPSGELPLVEFQQLGVERLRLLQHVESNAIRTDLKTLEERKQNLSTTLGKDGLKYFVHLLNAKGCRSHTETDLLYRRKDHISHFILRLSVCHDTDRQMWFMNQEIEFFKLRFDSLDKEGVEKLLSLHKIDCQQITPEEKDRIKEELYSSTSKVLNIDITEFYKVPFRRVTDLIRSRRVYVSQGIAYVPHTDLVSVFVSHFRKNMHDGMSHARLSVSNVCDDERIISFLDSLPGYFAGMTRVVWTTVATPIDKLDELSKTSYPLCMRILHEALKNNHHLKNNGRIQYGLFIKGIGVTMEDALDFWKKEFTKKLDADKFDKEYGYAIRHLYGREGKQTNYTPLGCPKIISSSVGPGEYHGCPYKCLDNESLRQKLFNYGIPAASINEIAELSKDWHYNIACTTYFKALHNRLPEKPIIHPNGYFVESRNILAKDNPAEVEGKERFSQSLSQSFSQSGKLSDKIGTPKRIDRNNGTPLRNTATPSTSTDRTATPSRKMERANMTPVKPIKATPKRIENHLNDDEIAELMSEDM
ncbi:DNA primase large subunit [Anthophora quadrimaculata]